MTPLAVFLSLALLTPIIAFGYLRLFRREGNSPGGRSAHAPEDAAGPAIREEGGPRTLPAPLSKEEKWEEVRALSEKFQAHLETMLEIILVSRPNVARALVLFYDRDGGELQIQAVLGRDGKTGVAKQVRVRIGEGLLGWIAKERRIVTISDVQGQKEKLEYDDGTLPVRSLLTVPLIDQELFEGLLCIDSLEDHAFSGQEETFYQLIAKGMLTALQHYRGQMRMHQRTREYAALIEISKSLSSRLDLTYRLNTTIEAAKEIVDYDACFIFLVEAGERRATVKGVKGYDAGIIDHTFSLTNGLLSIIVKNRQILLFSDAMGPGVDNKPVSQKSKIFPDSCRIQIDSHSFMGVPMVIESRVLGVVLFASNRENAFTTYDRHLLSIMCNYVAASIAEAQTHAQVEKMAITDGLTGIFNHRRFQERLQEEFDRTARHPEPFSLLLIDIDHFKKINDLHGHPAGDAVIKTVARVLTKTIRKVDTVARYGGEEFIVLLVKSNSKLALQMAERIRKAVEAASIEWQGKRIEATVSVGIAAQPEDALKREDLIAFADRALYASKQSGRNRSTLYKDLIQDVYEVG